MASRFDVCLPRILKHEGGYVNHPRDPGGATNKGIIQRTYDSYNRQQGRRPRPVKDITDAEVAAIYEANYWSKTGKGLPAGVDYCAFDGGVNSGPSRGVKWVQSALGVAADGSVGPKTINAAKAHHDKTKVVKAACARRMSFLRGLSHWNTFGRGWTRRVTEVEAVGVDDVLKAKGVTDKSRKGHAEKSANDAVRKKKAADKTAGGAGAGGVAGGSGFLADMDPGMMLILGIGIGILIVVALYSLRRSRIEKERDRAYRNVAAGIS